MMRKLNLLVFSFLASHSTHFGTTSFPSIYSYSFMKSGLKLSDFHARIFEYELQARKGQHFLLQSKSDGVSSNIQKKGEAGQPEKSFSQYPTLNLDTRVGALLIDGDVSKNVRR